MVGITLGFVPAEEVTDRYQKMFRRFMYKVVSRCTQMYQHCEARFKGDGCAISMAAASLLTELVVGTDISNLITNEQLISSLQSEIQPARVQCAVLPLTALRDGLKHR